MKKIPLIFLISVIVSSIYAQPYFMRPKIDSVFYNIRNGFLTSCPREKAEGYSVKNSFNPAQYTDSIYYLQSGTVMVGYEMYDIKYKNANSSVSAIIPVKNGRYEEWYISGEKRVSTFYTKDKLNGDFTVFYKNGKIKRTEKWQEGEWQEGECFDDSGNKTDYCSYQEMAEFTGGFPALYNFIGQELKYPKYAQMRGIQGVVKVQFVVDTDGSITDVKIKNGIEDSLNEEALRIVNAMPKWKPARFEGKLVKMDFTLPIRFKLE
jgi:TonB family protein